MRLPQVNKPQAVFNFADAISLSVAAASILAKVTRDRLLIELDAQYPAYHFARHKGYGTQIHQAALQSVGPCAIHRKSFKPISALLTDRLTVITHYFYSLRSMEVTLVHDWLNQMGGAEAVLENLVQLYPRAPIYTSIYWRDEMPPSYLGWDIRPLWLNHAPHIYERHQQYFALYPRRGLPSTSAATTWC